MGSSPQAPLLRENEKHTLAHATQRALSFQDFACELTTLTCAQKCVEQHKDEWYEVS